MRNVWYYDCDKRESREVANIRAFLESDSFVALLIISIGFSGFFMGRMSAAHGKDPIEIKRDVLQISEEEVQGEEGALVGSKNATIYHFPWCQGAKRIKDSNKIYFQSEEEAKQKGYSPAKNCQGLDQ